MAWVKVIVMVCIIAAIVGVVFTHHAKTSTVLDELVQDGYTVNRVVIDDTNGNAAIYLKRGN